jgi:hypothetical protein
LGINPRMDPAAAACKLLRVVWVIKDSNYWAPLEREGIRVGMPLQDYSNHLFYGPFNRKEYRRMVREFERE